MNLLKYTNGTGHLIMSIVFVITGLGLVIYPYTDAAEKGVGLSLILTVGGAWFVPGAARQMAEQISNDVQQQVTTPQIASQVATQVANQVAPQVTSQVVKAITGPSPIVLPTTKQQPPAQQQQGGAN